MNLVNANPRVQSMHGHIMENPFVYCVEILPRLKSVQISLLVDYHKLSLFRESIVITAPEPSHEQKVENGGDDQLKCSLGSYRLNLTCHSPPQLHGGILSLKVKALEPLPPAPPPCDMFRSCNTDTTDTLSLSCGFCNSKLTEPENTFKRVLPLPSESWAEFSGGIFCHYQEGDMSRRSKECGIPVVTPSTFKITPRDGDCLYSMSTVLLTESSLDKQRIHKEPTSRNIQCSRCLMLLGSLMISNGTEEEQLSTKEVSVPVSLHRSKVVPSAGSLPSPSPSPVAWLEDHFAFQLYSFTQSKMAFRYFVKDHGGHNHLHIWMLNVCCELLCNSDPEVCDKFSGCESSEGTGNVLKLLFKCDVDEVKNDSSLDSDMELTTEECLQLKLLLVNSNRSLPPAQRRASGYNVGYLHFFLHS